MDGIYCQLPSGDVYHTSDHNHSVVNFHLKRQVMLADFVWHVEQNNWVVIKNRHDGYSECPPLSTFTEIDKAQIVLSARPTSEFVSTGV